MTPPFAIWGGGRGTGLGPHPPKFFFTTRKKAPQSEALRGQSKKEGYEKRLTRGLCHPWRTTSYFGGNPGLLPLIRMPPLLAAALFSLVPEPDCLGVFEPFLYIFEPPEMNQRN